MNTISLTKTTKRTILIDIALLTLLCLIPSVSHVTGLSFRFWEPMRIALFAGVLMVESRINGYLLALFLPIGSMIISGMPYPIICALMIPELLLNVLLYHLFVRITNSIFLGMLVSIILSKAFFYLCKLGVMNLGILYDGTVIGDWQIQLFISVALAAAFALLFNFKFR